MLEYLECDFLPRLPRWRRLLHAVGEIDDRRDVHHIAGGALHGGGVGAIDGLRDGFGDGPDSGHRDTSFRIWDTPSSLKPELHFLKNLHP